jgi:hypothetical protein
MRRVAHSSRRFVERIGIRGRKTLLLQLHRRRRFVQRLFWGRLSGLLIVACIAHFHTPSSGLRSTAKFSSSGGVASSSGVSGAISVGSGASLGSVTSTRPPHRPWRSPPSEESFAQAGDRRSGSYRLSVTLVVDRRRSLVQGHTLGGRLGSNRLDRGTFSRGTKHQKLTTEIRIASATPTADNPARKKRPAHITA